MSFSSGEDLRRTGDKDAMFNTPAGHAGITFIAATGDSPAFPADIRRSPPMSLGVWRHLA